jgi:hypothetical protein
MDMIDGDEELSYIDEDVKVEIDKSDLQASVRDKASISLPEDTDPAKGSKAGDPIELGSTDTEMPEEKSSRSPPPSFDEVERNTKESIEGGDTLGSKGDDTLLLETLGTMPSKTLSFFEWKSYFRRLTYYFCDFSVAITLVTMGTKDKRPRKEQGATCSFGFGTTPPPWNLVRFFALSLFPYCI